MTIEIQPEFAKRARENFAKAEVEGAIDWGRAVEIVGRDLFVGHVAAAATGSEDLCATLVRTFEDGDAARSVVH